MRLQGLPDDFGPPAAWPTGPERPVLLPGEVHVWLANLSSADAASALSSQERRRQAGFARPVDGARWAAARDILRRLLGAYTSHDPSALVLATGSGGKPFLAGDPGPPLRFNLTHSGPVALFAFAPEAEVGIDVELAPRGPHSARIARRLFGPEEAERLEALAPEEREREFLLAWTRYEARVKCLGTGIAGRSALSEAQAPWVRQLPLEPPQAAAALAVASAPSLVRHWRWPPSGQDETRT